MTDKQDELSSVDLPTHRLPSVELQTAEAIPWHLLDPFLLSAIPEDLASLFRASSPVEQLSLETIVLHEKGGM